MSDLISRQATIDAINQICPIDTEYDCILLDRVDIICVLKDLPSAQPERKKGKWQITGAYPHNVYCSECHKRFAQTHWFVWEDGSLPRNYCPNCGARMDAE